MIEKIKREEFVDEESGLKCEGQIIYFNDGRIRSMSYFIQIDKGIDKPSEEIAALREVHQQICIDSWKNTSGRYKK